MRRTLEQSVQHERVKAGTDLRKIGRRAYDSFFGDDEPSYRGKSSLDSTPDDEPEPTADPEKAKRERRSEMESRTEVQNVKKRIETGRVPRKRAGTAIGRISKEIDEQDASTKTLEHQSNLRQRDDRYVRIYALFPTLPAFVPGTSSYDSKAIEAEMRSKRAELQSKIAALEAEKVKQKSANTTLIESYTKDKLKLEEDIAMFEKLDQERKNFEEKVKTRTDKEIIEDNSDKLQREVRDLPKDERDRTLREYLKRLAVMRSHESPPITFTTFETDLPDNLKKLLLANNIDRPAQLVVFQEIFDTDPIDPENVTNGIKQESIFETRFLDLVDSGMNPKDAIKKLREQGKIPTGLPKAQQDIVDEVVKGGDTLGLLEAGGSNFDQIVEILKEKATTEAELLKQIEQIENLLIYDRSQLAKQIALCNLLNERANRLGIPITIDTRTRIQDLRRSLYDQFGAELADQLTSKDYDKSSNYYTELQEQIDRVSTEYDRSNNDITDLEILKLKELAVDIGIPKVVTLNSLNRISIRNNVQDALAIHIRNVAIQEFGGKIPSESKLREIMDQDKYNEWLLPSTKDRIVDSMDLGSDLHTRRQFENIFDRETTIKATIDEAYDRAMDKLQKRLASGEISAAQHAAMSKELANLRSMSTLELGVLYSKWEGFKLNWDKFSLEMRYFFKKHKGLLLLLAIAASGGVVAGAGVGISVAGSMGGGLLGTIGGVGVGGLAGVGTAAGISGLGYGGMKIVEGIDNATLGYLDTKKKKSELEYRRKRADIDRKIRERTEDRKEYARLAYSYVLNNRIYNAAGLPVDGNIVEFGEFHAGNRPDHRVYTPEEIKMRLRYARISPNYADRAKTEFDFLQALDSTEDLAEEAA